MLPLLAMGGEGDTGARTAKMKIIPIVATPKRSLQVGSRFLPIPKGFILGDDHFVLDRSDSLEQAAEDLLNERHSSAIHQGSFQYVYIGEKKRSVVILSILDAIVYSITRAVLTDYDDYEQSEVLDSVPLRRGREHDGAEHTAYIEELRARIEELRARIEEMRAELAGEEAASRRLLAEKASLPVFITTPDGDAARLRRQPDPPKGIDPLIQKPQARRPPRPKKPVPAQSSPGSSEQTEPTEPPSVMEPLIEELDDD